MKHWISKMFILHERSHNYYFAMAFTIDHVKARSKADFIKLLKDVLPMIVGKFKKPFVLFPYSLIYSILKKYISEQTY